MMLPAAGAVGAAACSVRSARSAREGSALVVGFVAQAVKVSDLRIGENVRVEELEEDLV